MWVFIRPGVVRSANEEKAKLGWEFCPIHRFDGNYQFLVRSRRRCSDMSPDRLWNYLRSALD